MDRIRLLLGGVPPMLKGIIRNASQSGVAPVEIRTVPNSATPVDEVRSGCPHLLILGPESRQAPSTRTQALYACPTLRILDVYDEEMAVRLHRLQPVSEDLGPLSIEILKAVIHGQGESRWPL